MLGTYDSLKGKEKWMDGRMNGWIDGWKTQLYVLLTVFQSYQSYHDDGWIIK